MQLVISVAVKMGYKSKMYAKVLTDLISEKKSPVEQKSLADKFLKALEKNRDIKKAKEIIHLTEDLFFKKTGNRKITIETARKISDKHILKDFIKKNDIIEEKINPEIVAGIKVIINNEEQLDFSLKKRLDEIFSK